MAGHTSPRHTAGVRTTPDDWDPTLTLNGPDREGRPIPRSNWPRLLAGFAALLVAATLIVVAIRYVWPGPTGPSRADGEQRLHSIVLPDGWQRSTITYRDPFWGSDTSWSEEIIVSSADADKVTDTLNSAIRAGGFTLAGCQPYYPDELSCTWYAEAFSLTSIVRGFAPLLKAPCPAGVTECSQVWLTLTHRPND
jgi:hypothetical protein